MIAGEPRSVGTEAGILLAAAYATLDGRAAGPEAIAGLARLLVGEPIGVEAALAALGRLRDLGLVEEGAGTFRAAEPVTAFLLARAHRRGVREDLHDLARLLGLQAP